MVKINRVYTGGGDKGESSLVDGSRRKKSDPRFTVVGACDEANSWLGVILAEINRLPDHDDGGERTNVSVQTVLNEAVVRVQNELFDLGAELACPPETLPDYMVLLSQGQTDVLMAEMDAWLTSLPELTVSFSSRLASRGVHAHRPHGGSSIGAGYCSPHGA